LVGEWVDAVKMGFCSGGRMRCGSRVRIVIRRAVREKKMRMLVGGGWIALFSGSAGEIATRGAKRRSRADQRAVARSRAMQRSGAARSETPTMAKKMAAWTERAIATA
jgi:hypothetical protein